MLRIPSEIIALFGQDSVYKNIRVVFPNQEFEDITNEKIVSESLNFNESICSRENIKMGLAENSTLEFEAVGIPNITNSNIEVAIEIECESTTEGAVYKEDLGKYVYSLPIGHFIVVKAEKQADMTHRKVTCYGRALDVLRNISNDKSSIEHIKQNFGISRSTAYSFDILKFLMMNCNLQGIEGTEAPVSFTREDIETNVAGESTWSGSWYLTVLCDGVEITNPSTDIYKLHYGTRTKNNEEIAQEVKQELLTREYLPEFADRIENILRSAVIDKGGLFLGGFGGSGIASLSSDAKAEGEFVYPRVSMSTQEDANTRRAAIYMPRAIKFLSRDESFRIRDEFSIDFMTGNSISLFTPSNIYPTFNYSIPRVAHYPFRTTPRVATYYVDAPNVEFDKLVESYLELIGYWGLFARNGNMSLIRLKTILPMLYPSYDIYPSDLLFPDDGTAIKIKPERTIDCWFDDELTKPFNKIEMEYTNSSSNAKEVLTSTWNVEGYTDAECKTYKVGTDNYILQNVVLTTAQAETFISMMREGLEGVKYMPSTVNAYSMPYVEAGDDLKVYTNEESFITFALSNKVTGIQMLVSNFESK